MRSFRRECVGEPKGCCTERYDKKSVSGTPREQGYAPGTSRFTLIRQSAARLGLYTSKLPNRIFFTVARTSPVFSLRVTRIFSLSLGFSGA
jgi:hypothetical protein